MTLSLPFAGFRLTFIFRNVRKYLFFLCLLLQIAAQAQPYKGRVVDSLSGEGLPFATIKLGDTRQGLVTDLNGFFETPVSVPCNYLEFSYLGYRNRRIETNGLKGEPVIRLSASGAALTEVVFTPPYDKIRRILNKAIANRDRHNPDKMDWYRCHTYYKMVADMKLPDSVLKKQEADTSQDSKDLFFFLGSQHLLMSETYSIRTWEKPQKLQEEVIASRLSGFKKSLFTSLITDVLPFHSYNDYFNLNGKDYHNPMSKGYGLRYDFNLNDEVLQGEDTIWVLSFRPKNKNSSDLRGTVYIHSDGFAISQLIATAWDETLQRKVRLEQQYQRVEGRWFPEELNYIIDWRQRMGKDSATGAQQYYNLVMKGNSKIDSVDFRRDERFRFDKTHTVKLKHLADERKDEEWNLIRPVALDHKEQRTYQYTDSIMEVLHFDKYVHYLDKITDGKIPVSVFDISLARLYSYNRWEGSRFGLGLQTNEKIARWFSAGGWFGYGLDDRAWKYGGFAEVYADPYKEFVFGFSYDRDLRDPGRVQIHKDLDKNYLRRYLMFRVDDIESYTVSIKKRLGYLNLELNGRREHIQPLYHYNLVTEEGSFYTFDAKELSLGLRYAFAERRAPMFGRYYNTGSRFPILYGKITAGAVEYGKESNNYVQVVGALQWQKHLNRIGNERFRVVGGWSESESPLPLSKLFAGNGFRYDKSALYSFGGLLTAYPYDFYMDRFISLFWRHDFDWKIAETEHSAPTVSLQYDMVWGELQNAGAQKYVSFSVPKEPYHETGLLLNNLVRINYLNLCYIGMDIGYFYHWTTEFDADKNGRFVYGLNISL